MKINDKNLCFDIGVVLLYINQIDKRKAVDLWIFYIKKCEGLASFR